MLLVRAGKGNKVRSVPLNASTREALAIYIASRLGLEKGEKVLLKAVSARWSKAKSLQSFELLWLSRKGGALTTSAVGQTMAELVKAAGKLVPEETSAHSLRHTFARSYLSIYPGDVVGLATLLGHSSLDTTRSTASLPCPSWPLVWKGSPSTPIQGNILTSEGASSVACKSEIWDG